jgi:NADH:ubiquinone oxidoreductase subunit D
MFENIDNNIYSSPGGIYIERLDKSLRQFLEPKSGKISRAGKDVLVEIDQDQTEAVLKELKENPELSLSILKNARIIWEDGKSYLLLEIAAGEYDNAVILKTVFSGKASKKIISESISKYYMMPALNTIQFDKEEKEFDLEFPGYMLTGPASFNLGLNVDGGIIGEACIDSGPLKTLHREFFKDLEVDQLISYMGRFDHNAGIFPELAFCRGIEGLLHMEVPRRAEYLRVIMSELFRMTSHLDLLSRLSEIVGHDMAANILMVQRENLLGLIELVTGARVIPNFVRIGGVSSRVGSDVLKKIKRVVAAFIKEFDRAERMLMADFTLVEKLKGLGTIKRDQASNWGLTGPNLRASGPRYDLRKNPGHGVYNDIHFTVSYARGGSCLERIDVRIKEIYQSARIVNQAINKIPAGPALKRINLAHLDFEPVYFTSSVECPHGLFKMFSGVEGRMITAFTIMGASGPVISAAVSLLEGNTVDDIEVILTSLDISGGEVQDYV